jgi:hypothetical protein
MSHLQRLLISSPLTMPSLPFIAILLPLLHFRAACHCRLIAAFAPLQLDKRQIFAKNSQKRQVSAGFTLKLCQTPPIDRLYAAKPCRF